METETLITLVPNTGDAIEVPRRIACVSKLVSSMLDILEDEEPVIPLPNLDGAVLKKIIKFCEHHVDDVVDPNERPFRNKNSYLIEEFDQKLLDVPQEELRAIGVGADYLNIKALFDTAAKAIAHRIRGKPLEEIKRILGVEEFGDLTSQIENEHREFMKGKKLF